MDNKTKKNTKKQNILYFNIYIYIDIIYIFYIYTLHFFVTLPTITTLGNKKKLFIFLQKIVFPPVELS